MCCYVIGFSDAIMQQMHWQTVLAASKKPIHCGGLSSAWSTMFFGTIRTLGMPVLCGLWCEFPLQLWQAYK